MAGVAHAFVSAKADGADATQVRPSNWNADHKFIGANLGALLYVGASDVILGLNSAAGVPYLSGVGVVPVITTAPTLVGTNFTALNATQLTTGTVPLARLVDIADAAIAVAAAIAWTKISKTGSSLADLITRSAGDLSTGLLLDARVAASNVTQHQAALTILETQITDGALLARVGGTETISGAWTFTNAFVASSLAGPNAIGSAPIAGVGLTMRGQVTAVSGAAFGTQIAASLTAAANADVFAGVNLGSVAIVKGAFTGLNVYGIRMFGSNMSATGTGTITNAALVYIADAPTIGTNNYALWVDSGAVRFDGDIQTQALIALGGGAAPTLGTIGGSGPAVAAQNTWARFTDAAGVAYWVPAWK